MEEQKNEFLLWIGICAIIGLFILFMPNIERFLFGRPKREKAEIKEEVKKEKVIKSGRVTCGGTISDNSTSEFLLFYENNKVNKVIMTINTIYKEKNDDFKNAQEACSKVSEKYANQKGYKATCTNTDMTITNKQEFDLKTFETFTVTDANGLAETVSIDIKNDANIETAVKEIKKSGFVCK